MNITRAATRHLQGRSLLRWLAFAGSIALLVIFVVLFLRSGSETPGSKSTESLFVYCAAGIKVPVEAVARDYEKAYGTRVELTFGPSQTLLANIALTSRGDLYIPADESYFDAARKKELIAEVIPLAEMNAVLALKKGAPTNIHSLREMATNSLTLAQANPD